MIPRDVKSPTRAIPFERLLKVVAIVDRDDPQTKELLDHIRAERYEVEICDDFERDVSEDAAVGAYVALVDGDRLERARRAGDRRLSQRRHRLPEDRALFVRGAKTRKIEDLGDERTFGAHSGNRQRTPCVPCAKGLSP